MTVYILIIILLTAFSLFRNAKWPLFISFVALLVVGGLRGVDVGTDTKSYEILFELYSWDKSYLYHATEPLYVLLQFLMVKSGIGYEGLVFVTMAIMLVMIYLVIIRWSDHPNFSILCYVLLYFYFNSFNTTRQYMAIPFVMFFYYFIVHGNKKWGLISVAIATLLHYYAIISLIVLLVINKQEIKIKWLCIALVVTFILGVTPIVQQIIQYLSAFFPMFTSFMESVKESWGPLFSFSRLLLNVYVIFLLFVLQDKDSMLILLTIGVCMLNLFAFQPVVGRLAQYFTVIQVIIIPAIPVMSKQKKNAGVYTIISVLYMVISWMFLISSNIGGVVPWEMGELKFFVS